MPLAGRPAGGPQQLPAQLTCGSRPAGVWAGAVGRMAGVKVPLVAMHHAYVVTERIEGIQVRGQPRASCQLWGAGLGVQGPQLLQALRPPWVPQQAGPQPPRVCRGITWRPPRAPWARPASPHVLCRGHFWEPSGLCAPRSSDSRPAGLPWEPGCTSVQRGNLCAPALAPPPSSPSLSCGGGRWLPVTLSLPTPPSLRSHTFPSSLPPSFRPSSLH